MSGRPAAFIGGCIDLDVLYSARTINRTIFALSSTENRQFAYLERGEVTAEYSMRGIAVAPQSLCPLGVRQGNRPRMRGVPLRRLFSSRNYGLGNLSISLSLEGTNVARLVLMHWREQVNQASLYEESDPAHIFKTLRNHILFSPADLHASFRS